MILYFTGTGNSEYLALALRDALADDCVDAREGMRRGEAGRFDSESPYVFVFPTYAWRMPHVFEDYLRTCMFGGCRKAYFVMVCGADTGNAGACCARARKRRSPRRRRSAPGSRLTRCASPPSTKRRAA